MDYVVGRKWIANKIYLNSSVLAHNLMRELQMQAQLPQHKTSHNRRALWSFEKIDTLRNTFIAKAGRLSRPQGKLTLSMNANTMVQSLIFKYINIA